RSEASVRIPKVSVPSPPSGDTGAIKEAARLLTAAETPLIIAQRAARTPKGIAFVVKLAETLQAPVTSVHVSGATVSDRMNFPNRHPLCGAGYPGYEPDLTLGLEVQDMSPAVQAAAARGGKTISISAEDLFLKSNYQDFQRLADVDLAI